MQGREALLYAKTADWKKCWTVPYMSVNLPGAVTWRGVLQCAAGPASPHGHCNLINYILTNSENERSVIMKHHHFEK